MGCRVEGARRRRFARLVGIGTIFLGDPDYAGIADLAEGSYTALPFFTVADAPGVQPFLEAYGAEFGEGEIPSGGEGVGAYDAVWLYKQAVEQAGSTDPAAVAGAMVGQTFDGPTGSVEMMPSSSQANDQPRPGPNGQIRAGRFVRKHGPGGGVLAVGGETDAPVPGVVGATPGGRFRNPGVSVGRRRRRGPGPSRIGPLGLLVPCRA